MLEDQYSQEKINGLQSVIKMVLLTFSKLVKVLLIQAHKILASMVYLRLNYLEILLFHIGRRNLNMFLTMANALIKMAKL
jgi:hypothetical protein